MDLIQHRWWKIRWDLRRLVARVVNRVAERFVAIEHAGLEELLKTSHEGLGPARQFDQMVDVVVRIEGVRPRHVLIERI